MRTTSSSTASRSDGVSTVPAASSLAGTGADPVTSAPAKNVPVRRLKILAVLEPTSTRSYSDLKAAATAGDPTAAYSLFRQLQACRRVLSRSASASKPTPSFDPTWCEQVPADELDYRIWLRKAIEGHDIPATLAAYREDVASVCDAPDSENLESTSSEPPSASAPCPLLDESMQAAVKAGSLNAMVALGARSVWNESPDAYVNAYAYISAADAGLRVAQEQGAEQAEGSGSSARLIASEQAEYAKWLTRLSPKLNSEQLARAQSLSEQIISNTSDCCQLFPRELQGTDEVTN